MLQLKQKQYSPIDTEKQVALIFAGSQGFLDEIDIENMTNNKQLNRVINIPNTSHNGFLTMNYHLIVIHISITLDFRYRVTEQERIDFPIFDYHMSASLYGFNRSS